MVETAGTGTSEDPTRIVVGIDGSKSSKRALAWAAEEARLRGAPLEVVITWELPTTYGWAAPLPVDIDLQKDAGIVADEAVKEVLGPQPGRELDLRIEIIEGHPAAVLLHEAETAALVIVGSRGYGSFTGMLLGSVGQHLTAHARCPVVIVRDGEDDGRKDGGTDGGPNDAASPA
jgi:nucleotide-binding universal stress UspA family protein